MSNYVHLFSGSFVESNALTYELSKLGIQFIIKDQQNSANLAGFGIPNYLFSCEVFVKTIDYTWRIEVRSQSGTAVNCFYTVEAEELSQG